jgi:hypothetical protein
MRIISYDIGIKNLAYCLLEYENNKLVPETELNRAEFMEHTVGKQNLQNRITILDWNVLSLLQKEVPTEQCTQMIPGKTKKLPACKCTKVAKYSKKGLQQFYCERHAKKCDFIVPTKKHSRQHLKKLKVPELEQLAKSIFLFDENLVKQKKDEIIDKIAKFYEKKCLEPIIQEKTENAGDADLILIGKRMKLLLNENEFTKTITHVLIENQISPIATRMKTLQGMLTQYYIDHLENVDITFVSSVHKLKQFQGTTGSPNNEKNIKEKTNYQDHKVSGVTFCNKILENNPVFKEWIPKMDTKKKDDLADCFLQGLWYFKQKNLITYADDLTISYK